MKRGKEALEAGKTLYLLGGVCDSLVGGRSLLALVVA